MPTDAHTEDGTDSTPDTDPRVVRSRAAVLEATMALLLEGGVHATTVDAVTERSGVSKATIYRHWDSRHQLVLDALATLKPAATPPSTGSLRDDLVALVTELADHLGSPAAAVFCSMAGAAEHDAELADLRIAFSTARGHALREVVTGAVERGELPADLDVDLFSASVVGPLFYTRLARGETIPAHWPVALVDAALTVAGADTAS